MPEDTENESPVPAGVAALPDRRGGLAFAHDVLGAAAHVGLHPRHGQHLAATLVVPPERHQASMDLETRN
jgi:hypothetical protein